MKDNLLIVGVISMIVGMWFVIIFTGFIVYRAVFS